MAAALGFVIMVDFVTGPAGPPNSAMLRQKWTGHENACDDKAQGSPAGYPTRVTVHPEAFQER